jgi:hypothetical protein
MRVVKVYDESGPTPKLVHDHHRSALPRCQEPVRNGEGEPQPAFTEHTSCNKPRAPAAPCRDPALVSLFKRVRKNEPTLRTVSLNFKGVGTGGTLLIARALHSNSTLTILQLSGNQIGPEGVVQLAEALQSNAQSALTALDLTSPVLLLPVREALCISS